VSTDRAIIHAAYEICLDDLAHAPLGASIPSSADVRALLKRADHDYDVETIFDVCRELNLALADNPAESDTDVTRKLPKL
jgi:hypothetical protein